MPPTSKARYSSLRMLHKNVSSFVAVVHCTSNEKYAVYRDDKSIAYGCCFGQFLSTALDFMKVSSAFLDSAEILFE